jgi:hypothetical protein
VGAWTCSGLASNTSITLTIHWTYISNGLFSITECPQVHMNYLKYCHVFGLRVTKITGSRSDDWIYHHLPLQSLFKYGQYSATADLLPSRITRTCYPFPGNVFITQKLSLQITMNSSCHFVFNHSVLLCPNLYSTQLNSDLMQSQSYFTTGGLPPISLSWRQAIWDSRPEFSPPPTEPLQY